MKVGDIFRDSPQGDIWQQQQRVVAKGEKPGQWVVEYLEPDEEVIERIFEFWVEAEARGGYRSRIWSKTRAECAEGEEPEIIGYMTYEEMLERDLAEVAARAGRRSTIRVVSRAEWARYF